MMNKKKKKEELVVENARLIGLLDEARDSDLRRRTELSELLGAVSYRPRQWSME